MDFRKKIFTVKKAFISSFQTPEFRGILLHFPVMQMQYLLLQFMYLFYTRDTLILSKFKLHPLLHSLLRLHFTKMAGFFNFLRLNITYQFIGVFLFMVLASCGQDKVEKDQYAVHRHIDTTTNNHNYYRHFEGRWGANTIELHLQVYNDIPQGAITLKATGLPIMLRFFRDSSTSEVQFYFVEDNPFTKDEDTKKIVWRVNNTLSGWTATRIVEGNKASVDIPLVESYGAGTVRLTAFSLADTAYLMPDRNMPQAAAIYQLILPTQSIVEESFAGTAIQKIMGVEDTLRASRLADWQLGLSHKIAAYFTSWRADMGAIFNPEDSLSAFAYNYYQDVDLSVYRNDHDWLCLNRRYTSYTGGAHGNTVSTCYNLDLKLNKVWNLEDIVTDSLALQPLLNEAARKCFNLKPEQSLTSRLMVQDVPPTGNVCVLNTGLAFIYNPYEIASYAEGEVWLYLPWQQVQLLLRPAFRDRMDLIRKKGRA